MGNICSELITAAVVLPITAGNYRRRQNGSWYYDGTISSMVFFLIFLAVVIIFTISKDIDIEQDKRLGIVFLLLTSIMIFGLIACVALGYIIKKHGIERVVLGRQNGSVTKLQLIFLWIFGVLSGLFSAFLVGQQIECEVLTPNIDGDGGFFWDSRFIFNVITMLFLFMEMIFISYFVQFKLKQSTTVRYVLFILVSANVSVWLHSVIIDNVPFPESILEKQFGNKSVIPACLHNSTFGNIIDKSKTVLSPSFLEFCLLSVTMLLEMWSPITIQTSGEELPTYQEITDSSYSMNNTERTTLLGNTVYHQGSNSGGRTNRTIYQLVSFFVSIVIGLGSAVVYVVFLLKSNNVQIRLLMEQYYIGINIAMVCANFLGYYCLVHYCKPDRISKPLKVSEYVYMSSAFGMIMLHVAETLSAYLSPDGTADLTLISYVLAIVQDYLQVVFLLHANRCRKSITHSNIHLLDCVLIFLIVINLSIWLTDSFVVEQFSTIKDIEQDILGDILWSLYQHILLPSSVFYRFSSALEMFATFKMYSVRH